MKLNLLQNLFERIKAKFGAENVQMDSSPLPARKTTFHHQHALNQMLKTIAACPMDGRLKSILRMRIWGKYPSQFAPMSIRAIARDLKCKDSDVRRWEEDALHNIGQFLNKDGIVTISEKFLRDGNVKEILEERKRIIA